MDSERRHELEENSLARALRRAPEVLWEYGAYLLLGLAIVLAVYLFFRNRTIAEQQQRQAVSQGLYSMVEAVSQAQRLAIEAPFLSPEAVADARSQLRASFDTYAPLTQEARTDGARSQALRLQGDFAYALGSISAQPATTELTATPPEDPRQWLDQAQAAYMQVLEDFPEQTADVQAALFGLAAIAEQRGEFEQARGYYERLIEREDIGAGTKEVARQRQFLLAHLRLNPRFAPPRAAAPAQDVPGTISAREILDRIIPTETTPADQSEQPDQPEPQQPVPPADEPPIQPPDDQPPATEPPDTMPGRDGSPA